MSIKVMTRVWEHSPQKGSALLCTLALADNADDDGICWPGQATTATKIRMSIRNTRRVLDGLETTGEIFREMGVGRGNKTLCLIATALTYEQLVDVLMRRFGINKKDAGLNALAVLSNRHKSGQDVLPDKLSQKRTPRVVKADKAERKTGTTVKNRHKNHQDSFAAKAAKGGSGSPKKPSTSSKKDSENPPKVPAKGSPAKFEFYDGEPKVQPHVALIEAHYYSIPQNIRPIGGPNYTRNVRVAQEMVQEGITVYDVVRYMALSYDGYTVWARQNKKPAVMTLEHVKTYIKDFLVGSKSNEQKDRPAQGRPGTNGLGTGVLASASRETSDLSPEHRQLLADNQRRKFGGL